MSEFTSEARDGMRIDWDVPLAMDDGLVVRADVYRPIPDGRYPVILSFTPDVKGSQEFSPDRHVYKFLAETPHCSISVVGWEPGQVSPIHSHPGADEIYYVLEGEGLFNDGRQERRLGPGDTVIFPAGEVHRVQSLTRMVLYRVRPGPIGIRSRWTVGRRGSTRYAAGRFRLSTRLSVTNTG